MSFYTALTGLQAATASLSVTSNNIANVGTTGFKRSRADFGDIFATSPLQKASAVIGQGVALKQVSQEFSQGNIQFSANSLDIAITGDGFFPLKSSDGLQDIYTRNGTFLLDDTFTVVNSAGQGLMAATVDSSGKADLENLKKLIIPKSTTGDAKQTSAIELALNLPADGAVIPKVFDPKDDTTYNLNTAVTIFDSGGNEYLATVYYKKTQKASPTDPTNKWQTFVYIGDTKLDEFLIQAADTKGNKFFVNKYGQMKAETDIPAELINRGISKLYNVDNLSNKVNSTPATLSGEALTATQISNWKLPGQRVSDALANAGGTFSLHGIKFKLKVDGSPTPVTVDLSKYNDSSVADRYTGTEFARIIENEINRAYGDDRYFDLSTLVDTGSTTNASLFALSVDGTSANIDIGAADVAAFTSMTEATLESKVQAALNTAFTGTSQVTSSGVFASNAAAINGSAAFNVNITMGGNTIVCAVAAGASTPAGLITAVNAKTGNAAQIAAGTHHGVTAAYDATNNVIKLTGTAGKDYAFSATVTDNASGNAVANCSFASTTTAAADAVTFTYDAPEGKFLFKPSNNQALTIKNQSSVTNSVFNIDGTAKTVSAQTFDYGETVIPEGGFINSFNTDYSQSNQRFGINVSFDETDGTFKIASGKTGDASSVEILFPNANTGTAYATQDEFDTAIASIGAGDQYPTGKVAYNALDTWKKEAMSFYNAYKLLGLKAGEQAIKTTPTRGIESTPAIVTGGAIGLNLDNRFSLTSETNTFTVTVDNVTGSVTLPLDKEYTFESFRTELEKRINSLEDAQGRTVNGVTVSQYKVGSANYLRMQTGTQGADAFLKVTGPSIWGLTNLESANGSTNQWLSPPQAENAAGVPLYVDRDGNETTEAGDFSEAETLNLWSPVYLDKGELTFDTAGSLQSPLSPIAFKSTTIGESGATLQFGINYDGSTQFSSAFSVYAQTQNGSPEGDLIGLDIGDDGLVSANYSNGTAKNLAKIVLANFSNATGLRQLGDSSYYETSKSGAATLGEAGTAGYGTLRAGARERANVDLTAELIELITAQRNFQANAKAIETNNTLTQAIINIRS